MLQPQVRNFWFGHFQCICSYLDSAFVSIIKPYFAYSLWWVCKIWPCLSCHVMSCRVCKIRMFRHLLLQWKEGAAFFYFFYIRITFDLTKQQKQTQLHTHTWNIQYMWPYKEYIIHFSSCVMCVMSKNKFYG